MARRPRDSKLETREARKALKQRKEPYWRSIHTGLYVGYYKGKNGGSWYIRSQEYGQRKAVRVARADDHADADGKSVLSFAQAVQLAMKGQPEEVRASQKAEGYTVAECVTDYLEDYRVRGKSQDRTEYIFNRHVLPKFGRRSVLSLKVAEIQKWLNALAKDRQPATVNRIFNSFRAALNFAVTQGRVDSDMGWRNVRPFKNVDKPVERYLTQAEASRLINACDPDFKKLVHAALLTGCRYGELSRVVANDYDPAAEKLRIPISKSGKPRYIPLTEEGCQWFDEWTADKGGSELVFTKGDGEPWGQSHQIRRMRLACETAKIEPAVSFHILRHTYGSLLARESVPLQVIAAVMGHSDTRMTERHYAHLQPDFVSETIKNSLPKFGDGKSNVRRLG